MATSLSPPQQSLEVSGKKYRPKTKKVPLPPTIIVDELTNVVLYELITVMMSGFKMNIINDKHIKINVPVGECYQALTKALNNKNFEPPKHSQVAIKI